MELRTALFFLASAAVAALLLVLAQTALPDDDDLKLIAAFTLGFILTCGLTSSLAPLLHWGHRLLWLGLVAAAASAAAIALDWSWLELPAKLLFAAGAGYWISLMLTSVSQIVLIAVLIILTDFYSVFLGPTKALVESGGPWLDYLTISLPVFGAPALSKIGISDIIFFCLFCGCCLVYGLRRPLTALAMTASFVGTMIVGVRLAIGVPALPLLSLSFLAANADLLYQQMRHELSEHRRRP